MKTIRLRRAPSTFRNKRVLIWGAGSHGGGLAAAQFCANEGAHVAILDRNPPSNGGDSAAFCLGNGWTWHTGQANHPVVRRVDYIITSPAIPPSALAHLPADAAPLLGADAIFFSRHQGPRIGVTGTKGKSTTARLLSLLIDWPLGGNSNTPLLSLLLERGPRCPVVCELSSFQLWYLQGEQPHFDYAICTYLGSDHLDWHRSQVDYLRSKTNLLDWSDKQVLSPQAAALIDHPTGMVVRCDEQNFIIDDDSILAHRASLRLRGEHNSTNACLALSVALDQGHNPTILGIRLALMQPLAHRLETVLEAGNVTFINDSTATTPEATSAAIAAVDGPLALITGGRSKGASYQALAEECAQANCKVVSLGDEPHDFLQALNDAGVPVCKVGSMQAAIENACALLGKAGGSILLSPACASAAPYHDFAARGDDFSKEALAIPLPDHLTARNQML